MAIVKHTETGQECKFDAAGLAHFRQAVPDPGNWIDTETGNTLHDGGIAEGEGAKRARKTASPKPNDAVTGGDNA